MRCHPREPDALSISLRSSELKKLSFLSTKRAVVTSVLSKQWKYLWTKVPTLKFDKSEHNNYISLVDKSLSAHQSRVLESFHLKSANSWLDANIGLWIRIALHDHHCHLREVEIDSEYVPLLLSPELFTLKTLVVLKLNGKKINVEAPLTTVCLPSLKTLHHQSRIFDFESLEKLLSSCNFLTDLVVSRDTTRSMVVNGSRYLEFDISWCKTVVALKLEGLKDVIGISSSEVCLPFLKTLHVSNMVNFDNDSFGRLLSNCPLLSDLTLDEKAIDVLLNSDVDMPNLQRLSIVTKIQGLSHLYILLKYIRNLATVLPRFKYFSIKGLWYVRNYSSIMSGRLGDPSRVEDAGMFGKILHVELDIGGKKSVEMLRLWLLLTSKLLVLKLNNVNTEGAGSDGWNPPSFVPQCFISSLKALEWRGYTGNAGDKDLLRYLLNHALCLKTAKIFYNPYPGEVRNQQIEEDLAYMPRSSKSCELVCEVMDL